MKPRKELESFVPLARKATFQNAEGDLGFSILVQIIQNVSGRGGKNRKLLFLSPAFLRGFDEFIALLIFAR